MTMQYTTAAGGWGLGVYEEFPDQILARADAILHNIDQLLPGYYESLSLSGLNIVWDARNRHRMFSQYLESKAMVYRPLLRIYLGASGIRRGLVHESWHILDILAGPAKKALQKGWKQQTGVSFLTHALYPNGPEKPDLSGTGGKILNVVLQAQITRGNMRGNALSKKICQGVDSAYDENTGWTLGDFLSERFANLLEEWYFYKQVRAGVKTPDGVGSRVYFKGDAWWGESWLNDHDQEVKNLFELAIQAIITEHREGRLKAHLDEIREEYTSDFLNLILQNRD
jgi:hypothetical protein